MSTLTYHLKDKRKWVYAKKPKGTLYNYRQVVGYLLLAFFFIAPFIKIGGEPLLMINIIERKFSIFGNVFTPQDFHIFVFGMLIAMVCIVLFTVVYGRIWCGWTCPQTIFMELVFRKIEYAIEGDAAKQRKADDADIASSVSYRKVLKHAIFFLISFIIANTFLAYIIGYEKLFAIIIDPIGQHWAGLASIILFTFVFYLVYAYVREIVCTAICPYGRLQGVMIDNQTTNVAYNYKRGEPRTKHQKKISAGACGDCIDCKLCVQVCPTGIDIRNGIQMECINCTACIDACDAVMEKLHKPKRLIGFYTLDEIEGKASKKKNTRAVAYSIVLVLLMGVFTYMLFSRSIINGTLLRAKGTSYIMRDDGTVANLYNLNLTNKTNETLPFELKVADDAYSLLNVGHINEIKPGEDVQLSFFLIQPKEKVAQYKSKTAVEVISNEKVVETLKTTFIAPVSINNKKQ
ncbi:cytochrome c oxidase accessory protein CcoG [Olivibacter sitiensis]|uniref:cytochrome c oxidase accessory protein CcoG n=1 Tax=Olivibacter sitiensis TaxID=376470 RepID=UPI0004054556|nr:cytochrome c oxidase accessory protein CcoG [Olivibacter sitiensis]